ncbi:MAG: DNA translocase FtsK [Bacteroidetes bacterium]|nr:DNA translocase FtsK [Bacteroidota bacterium]
MNDFLETAPNQKNMVGEDVGSVTIKSILKDPKTMQLLGLVMMGFSAYAILSYFSYWLNMFMGNSDQALIIGKNWNWLKINNPIIAHNFMGMFGAMLSYLIVYRWFGILAILPLLLLLNLGLKMFIGKTLFKQKSFSRITLFMLLWGTMTLGFIQGGQLYLGGGIGYFGVEWLKGLLGSIGTVFLIAISGFIFMVTYLKINILPSLNKAQNPADIDLHTDENILTTEPNPIVSDIEDTEASFDDEDIPWEEKPNEVILSNDADMSDSEDDIKLVNPDIAENQQEDYENPVNDEIPFAIEETSDIEVSENPENTPERKEHYGIDEPYDPWLDLPGYQFPTDDLLKEYEINKAEIDRDELESSKSLILNTLNNYNIGIKEIKATIGPTVTLYEIIPETGVRISKIKNLEDDIALSLAALGIRIIAPIPGKGTIGIEVPNKKPEMVPMSSVIKSKKFKESKFELPVILGKTISNELYIADLAKMPHLLVAGATGQGKSVGLNCLIISLLYKKHPTELKFVMVDPKKVELSLYNKLEKHFLAKLPGEGDAIITDTSQVTDTLKSLCIEMDNRYNQLKDAGCRNIIEYNTKFKERRLNPEKGHAFLPYIVVVVDEVADLMMTAGREVETPIARLAQLARAVGIHVILATQRPSVNIITGTIKANFPARLAFRVTSKIDSRTILDSNGADQLIGKGDMLFYSGSDLIRLQCPFVDTPEADAVADFISDQKGFGSAFILPEAPGEEGEGNNDFDAEDKDPLFDEAARIVVETQQGSTSMIQRKLKIGYNRAGRLIDQLEAAGIVGSSRGSKARDVLIHDIDSLEHFLTNLNIDN